MAQIILTGAGGVFTVENMHAINAMFTEIYAAWADRPPIGGPHVEQLPARVVEAPALRRAKETQE